MKDICELGRIAATLPGAEPQKTSREDAERTQGARRGLIYLRLYLKKLTTDPSQPMFILAHFMYIRVRLAMGGAMNQSRRRLTHKHMRLDAIKIQRAKKVLRASTETETVDRALDLVIAEDQRNRLAAEANERFVRSGAKIADVYGKLEG